MGDADAATHATDGGEAIMLKLTHHGTGHEFQLPADATLSDLNEAITSRLSIPAEQQKLMVMPKVGVLKPPYKNPSLPLSELVSKKIQLLAPLPSEIESLSAAAAEASSASARRSHGYSGPLKPVKPTRYVDPARAHADATYVFHKIVPLPYLPDPGRSQRFLERLASDPGIRAAMRKHRFSVGVLTEMDPAMHTTHEGKTLGLNRNRGEVIELRLRTDAYDGYRDYKTIRKTLCHELAHNVWGEHDRNFWDLTNQIEKEVGAADWTRGGRSVGEEEFYNPDDGGAGDHVDGGGWTGGEYVLGRSGGDVGEGAGGGSSSSGQTAGLSRRELMAQAAEERMKKQKETEKK